MFAKGALSVFIFVFCQEIAGLYECVCAPEPCVCVDEQQSPEL